MDINVCNNNNKRKGGYELESGGKCGEIGGRAPRRSWREKKEERKKCNPISFSFSISIKKHLRSGGVV